MWKFWDNVNTWDIVVEAEFTNKKGETETKTYYRETKCTLEEDAYTWANAFAEYVKGTVVSVTRR